ncbi:DUF4199 domain-containing protein [Zhouia sp. PK063]|uniref:DUF4199 domain-containing protein n=1 Tax=Zhouia sp. PK063 TaxID=3373602 RepID=UPI00378F4E6D
METNKIFLKFGVITAIGLIAYFLVAKLLGLHDDPWFRIGNGVIVGIGIYYAMKTRKMTDGTAFKYFDGLRTGVFTGFVATIIFVFFMSIYMYHIDKGFAADIIDKWVKDYHQGPAILLFFLTLEGFSSTVIMALTFMQKFKYSNNLKKSFKQV